MGGEGSPRRRPLLCVLCGALTLWSRPWSLCFASQPVGQTSTPAAVALRGAADLDVWAEPSETQTSDGGGAAGGTGTLFAGLSFALLASAASLARSARSAQRAAPPRAATAVALKAAAAGVQEMPILRLGTRGSPLALAQAYETKRRLAEKFPELAPDKAVDIRIISTTGDERLEISLAAIGGKGLFTRELDAALAAKEVDFCVHSTKDVPTELLPDTELITMLPREDTRDALIARDGKVTRLEDLPDGSVIGTASLRRQAQILAKNPTHKCVNFRGNVQTRLRKVGAGEVDATMLAIAGLKRMDMQSFATSVLEWDDMLPAVSQGAISFQCRSDDERVKSFLGPLNHLPTMQAVTCERAFLKALDGNCKTPIAGQAVVEDGQLRFVGLVASPDGQRIFNVERVGFPSEAEKIGREAGEEVRAEAGEEFFVEMQEYVQDMQAANSRPTRS